jgi:hypothetical protein
VGLKVCEGMSGAWRTSSGSGSGLGGGAGGMQAGEREIEREREKGSDMWALGGCGVADSWAQQ